jgi:hypothetical protein
VETIAHDSKMYAELTLSAVNMVRFFDSYDIFVKNEKRLSEMSIGNNYFLIEFSLVISGRLLNS